MRRSIFPRQDPRSTPAGAPGCLAQKKNTHTGGQTHDMYAWRQKRKTVRERAFISSLANGTANSAPSFECDTTVSVLETPFPDLTVVIVSIVVDVRATAGRCLPPPAPASSLLENYAYNRTSLFFFTLARKSVRPGAAELPSAPRLRYVAWCKNKRQRKI